MRTVCQCVVSSCVAHLSWRCLLYLFIYIEFIFPGHGTDVAWALSCFFLYWRSNSTRVGRWGGVRAPLGVRRAVASPPPSPPASPRALFVSFFTGLVRAHHWHTNRGKDFTLGTLSQPRQCQTVDTLVSSVDTPGAPASQGSKSFYRFFSLGPPNARNDQLLRLRGRAGGLDLEAQELPRPPDDLLVCRQLRDGGALVLAPLLPVLVAQTNSKTSRPLLRLRLRLRDAARDPERGALPRACRAYVTA